MLILTGKNLGERQKQLNEKVNDAAKDKIDFKNVEHQPETSDIDKLFKIDLAAKYKNVEYILEVFKSGDSFYISRALNKCTWLFHKDVKHVVNSDYLSEKVFPLMSIKMRSKVLKTVATHLNNDDERVINFYVYCMKLRLHNIALKFLFKTPESFKLEEILKKSKCLKFLHEEKGNYLKYFVGDSFNLAESYTKNIVFYQWDSTVYLLKYMYTVSNEKFLDMLETSNDNKDLCTNPKPLGRRISKHIMQNYKARIMKKPCLYVKILNQGIVSRNCTVEEAKILAVALLPVTPSEFFHSNYYKSYKYILDLIPDADKFSFIKKIFTEKYTGHTFEFCSEFYSKNLYDMMTVQEREAWALSNIVNQNVMIFNEKDYLWYKFVNFEKAFVELKKSIVKTTDRAERCEMLKTLIESANTDEQLTKLLNYYYDRHINEIGYIQNSILTKLVKQKKVWSLSEDCWKVLEKIFYSVKVFDNKASFRDGNSENRVLALMYYILNEKPVPEVFNDFLDRNIIDLYPLSVYNKQLGPEKEVIFQYLFPFYEAKIKALSVIKDEKDRKHKIRPYLNSALELAQIYNKTKDDLPEIVHCYVKLDWLKFMHHELLANKKLSGSDIMHYLKKDAEWVVTQLSIIKDYINSPGQNLNWLLHRLKVYFSHDMSQKILILFNECLSDDHFFNTEVAVRGILVLADETSKTEFLEKYAPKDKKIDHSNIFIRTLRIQEAICKQMHCSRPLVPLPKVFQYVVGDYVQYCLILFRSYLLNLPSPRCIEFVEWMIDKPISIQKHGLRLAFECFDEDKLKTITLNSWNKTKNVSLRMILYKLVYMKVSNESDADDSQTELFEVLITLTLDLNEDDDETLFQLKEITKLPKRFIGKYLESVWVTVTKFVDKPKKFDRMVNIINTIESNYLYLFPEDILNNVIDEHVNIMLDKKEILQTKLKIRYYDNMLKSKWNLTTSNLVYVIDEKKLKKNLEVVKHIIKQCVEMWDKHDENDNKYIIRQFLTGFLEDFDSKSYRHDEKNYYNVITILETIIHDLKEALPNNDIYMQIWKLNSSILTKKVILKSKLLENAKENDEQLLLKIRESGILLGSEFGKLIGTNKQDGKFYWMFCEQMESLVSNLIHMLTGRINRWIISSTDACVLFCFGLLENDFLETHMFALKLLPTEYEDAKYFEDYINAIKKVQGYQNTELQYYMHEKFVNTDFKPRKYITNRA